jgi:hypothetical protein
MKYLKFGLLLMLVIFALRGFLFRATVKYHEASCLPSRVISDQAFLQWLDQQPAMSDLDEIAKRSLQICAVRLRFTAQACDTDPNLLFASQKTNCIGYAAFFSATCQALLHQNHLEKKYAVRHLRGHLRFLGMNVHRWFGSPFFKDHDYNLIQDLETGQRYYLDASTYDLLGIGYVAGD